MQDALKGPLLCSLAMMLVGSTVVVSKVIGTDVEPFLATALRHAAALPVLLALMWQQGFRLTPTNPFHRLSRRDAVWLLLQAAAGSVGYTTLLIQGVAWSSAADASVVAGTLPAMAALFSAVFLGERPSARLVAAIVLATAGVLAVALGVSGGADAAADKPTRLAGIGLVLAATACESVFILGNKRLKTPLPPLAMSTLMCAGGLLLALVPALLRHTSVPSTLTPAAWGGIVYYAWLPTVAGFLLWYAGARRTSGTVAALTTVWLPVTALALSAALLGEAIRTGQWLGLACVGVAMALAAKAGR